jgi:hypothetical protein
MKHIHATGPCVLRFEELGELQSWSTVVEPVVKFWTLRFVCAKNKARIQKVIPSAWYSGLKHTKKSYLHAWRWLDNAILMESIVQIFLSLRTTTRVRSIVFQSECVLKKKFMEDVSRLISSSRCRRILRLHHWQLLRGVIWLCLKKNRPMCSYGTWRRLMVLFLLSGCIDPSPYTVILGFLNNAYICYAFYS